MAGKTATKGGRDAGCAAAGNAKFPRFLPLRGKSHDMSLSSMSQFSFLKNLDPDSLLNDLV